MAQTLEGLTIGMGRDRSKVTFLPEPDPRPRTSTIISVDDPLVEPPDTFEGRLPAKFADHAPRIVDHDDGAQEWRFEDCLIPIAATTPCQGVPRRSTRWTPHDSNTCAAVVGTSTLASPTWTSRACTPAARLYGINVPEPGQRGQ